MLNSKNFGVPQNRERVFIIGYLRGECGREVFPLIGSAKEIEDVPIKIVGSYLGEEQTAIGQRYVVYGDDGVIGALNATDYKQPKVIQVGNIVENKDTFAGNPQRGRVYSSDGISPCISTMQGGGQEPKIVEDDEIRKLTPKECWRLQGFPDWAFDRAKATGMSDTQLYKQAGNSVTVDVIEEIAMRLKEET